MGGTAHSTKSIPPASTYHRYHGTPYNTYLAVKYPLFQTTALLVAPFRRPVIQHALRVLEAHPALPRLPNHRRQRRAPLPLRLPGDEPYAPDLGHARGEAVSGERECSDFRREGLDELCKPELS